MYVSGENDRKIGAEMPQEGKIRRFFDGIRKRRTCLQSRLYVAQKEANALLLVVLAAASMPVVFPPGMGSMEAWQGDTTTGC